MLGGDILRQGNYPGFGYAVGYACEVSEHSTTRSGVDDTPATVADHQRNGVAAAQHVPSCVDLKRLSPDVHRRGGDIGVLRLSLLIRKRGIVEQDVEARSEEHTSELQSLMRISYAVFGLKKKKNSEEINKNKNT